MKREFLVKLNREFEFNLLRQPISPFLSRWRSARKVDFAAPPGGAGYGFNLGRIRGYDKLQQIGDLPIATGEFRWLTKWLFEPVLIEVRGRTRVKKWFRADPAPEELEILKQVGIKYETRSRF
jgi:hypothetical protein